MAGLYYDCTGLLKYDKMFSFAYSSRRSGKTYGIETYCIDDFLKTDGERKFMYIRRHDTQLINTEAYFQKFAGDGMDEKYYKGWEVKKGKLLSTFYYKGKVSGWCTSLNRLQSKGADFPGLKNLIFDEFIAKENAVDRYLPHEVTALIDAVITIGNYADDFRVYLLANLVKAYNPYFLELNYLYDGRRYWTSDEPGLSSISVVERAPEAAIVGKYKQSVLGKALVGTKLGEHVFDNNSLMETQNMIKKVTKWSDCLFIVQIDGRLYTFWVDRRNNDGYMSERLPQYYVPRYSVDDDRTKDFFALKALEPSPSWADLIACFNYGKLYYESNNAKMATFSLLKKSWC